MDGAAARVALPHSSLMGWTTPQYSRTAVDIAGARLIEPMPDEFSFVDWEEREEALNVINNWRSSHSFPLNTFQTTLRRRARKVDPKADVAQRIKRLSSIESKLEKYDWLQLSDMQDIGGCRAVLTSTKKVYALVDAYRRTKVKHALDDHDDYIAKPKKSGYRGYHLIYKYVGDKSTIFNGLKIEVQLRSQLQHAWATAVETVGTFNRQALKSGFGEATWLRFFALMGSAIALRERTPLVPRTPRSEAELRDEIRACVGSLQVVERLDAYSAAVSVPHIVDVPNATYYLMVLDINRRQVNVRGFRSYLEGADELMKVEKAIANQATQDAVLVAVDSISALKRAYPNYFLDTHRFLDAVREAIG